MWACTLRPDIIAEADHTSLPLFPTIKMQSVLCPSTAQLMVPGSPGYLSHPVCHIELDHGMGESLEPLKGYKKSEFWLGSGGARL